MADTKVSALTAATAITTDDAFYIVDDASGTPVSKKVTSAIVRDFGGMVYSAYSTDANLAAAVNTLYVADISGFTADRTLTLPGTAAVGDRVGLCIGTGDDAYEFLVTATAGDTLNGVGGGTEWSRLFITGEICVFRCVVANTTWIVEQDGRIPQQGCILLTTAPSANEAANTYVYATAAAPTAGVWTAQTNVGNCVDVATDKITMRRACSANVAVYGRPANALTDQKYFNAAAELNATTLSVPATIFASGAFTMPALMVVNAFPLAAGDYFRFKYRSEEGSKGLSVTAGLYFNTMSVVENLKP